MFVMDGGDVLQNIDLFSSTNSSKTIDSFLDNSSNCLRQLSSISFWDNFDNPQVDSTPSLSAPTIKAPQPSTAESPNSSDSSRISTNPSASFKHGTKRQRTPEKRRTRVSHDPSALDCSDYWLRFDSDDDSLERFGDYEHDAPARRQSDLIQPAPRIRRVGGPGGTFKLAFQSLEDDLEDSAVDHALSDGEDFNNMALDDDFMKGDSTQPADIAPERLYSTPLSWEQPQPGIPMANNYFNFSPAFNDPERQRLLAIALGTGMAPSRTASVSRPSTSTDFNFDVNPSPRMSDTARTTPEPRRKTSSPKSSAHPSPSPTVMPEQLPNNKEKPKEKAKNSERAAHNDIERKYRTNLKDRIAELREAVPSLRSVVDEDHDDGDSPVQASRAPKVSKGTVLTKATEYIRQLERRNRNTNQKNEELTRRLQAFEQLLSASSGPQWPPTGGYGPPSGYGPRGYPS